MRYKVLAAGSRRNLFMKPMNQNQRRGNQPRGAGSTRGELFCRAPWLAVPYAGEPSAQRTQWRRAVVAGVTRSMKPGTGVVYGDGAQVAHSACAARAVGGSYICAQETSNQIRHWRQHAKRSGRFARTEPRRRGAVAVRSALNARRGKPAALHKNRCARIRQQAAKRGRNCVRR